MWFANSSYFSRGQNADICVLCWKPICFIHVLLETSVKGSRQLNCGQGGLSYTLHFSTELCRFIPDLAVFAGCCKLVSSLNDLLLCSLPYVYSWTWMYVQSYVLETLVGNVEVLLPVFTDEELAFIYLCSEVVRCLLCLRCVVS